MQEKEAELKAIRHKLFGAKTKATKVKYRKKDEELRNEIADILKKGNLPVESAERLASWDPYDQNSTSPFFDIEWMFGIKDGFDVVIGNPPYIGEKGHSDIFQKLKKYKEWSKFFKKRSNLYYAFMKAGIDIAKSKGFLTYIVPKEYLTADYADNLRDYISNNARFEYLAIFQEMNVFDAASTSSSIFLFRKDMEKSKKFNFINCALLNNSIEIKTTEKVNQTNLNRSQWNFNQQKNDINIEKFLKVSNFFDISQGVVTGADRVSNKHIVAGLIDKEFKGSGIFVLKLGEDILVNETEIKLYFIKSKKWMSISQEEWKYIKPFIAGNDLGKWHIKKSDKFVIKIDQTKIKQGVLKEYLMQFHKILINRSKLGKYNSTTIDMDDFERFTDKDIKKYYSSAGAVQKVMKRKEWFRFLYPREKIPFNKPKIIVNSKNMFPFSYSFNEVISSGGGAGGQNFIFLKNNQFTKLSNKCSEKDFVRYVSIILNSDFIQSQIKTNDYNSLSIKKIFELPIVPIGNFGLVDQVLFLGNIFDFCKSNHLKNELRFFEKLINFIIHLSFLESFNLEFINLVKKDIQTFTEDNEFETLTGTQKVQKISEFHNRWSDPACEIVKQMNSLSL